MELITSSQDLSQALKALNAARTQAPIIPAPPPPPPVSNDRGEFANGPLQGALKMAAQGTPVAPVKAREKAPPISNFPNLATTDRVQILDWSENQLWRDCNWLVLAKPDGVCFVDEDDTDRLRTLYEQRYNEPYPDTRSTESRPGHRQSCWRQTDRTRAFGNHVQNDFVDKMLSFRQSNEYCLCEGSVHPSGSIYQGNDKPILEMPDKLMDLIESLRTDAAKKSDADKREGKSTPYVPPAPGEKITEGRNNACHDYAFHRWTKDCVLVEQLIQDVYAFNQEHCVPPLDEEELDRTTISSVQKHKQNWPVLVGGTVAGTTQPASSNKVPPMDVVPEIDTTELADRPVFPYWVIEGTTIGEGFVKPVIASSSKHVEFLFMPAVQLLINSLSGKVRMKYQTTKLNMFVGLVAPYGNFFKSTSCELAQQYFKEAGLATVYSSKVSNADAKTIISGASGSPEGFGKLMRKLSAKRAILYCDELGKFVSKAGIETSAWSSDLLTMYGSGDFNNTVKSEKDTFAFEAGTYCFSWLWCTTDRAFNRLWPKLAGISTGLEDRMFFVLCPPEPKENSAYQDPYLLDAAIETRKAVDAAVQQAVFDYEYLPAAQEALKGLDPRSMELVQTLSLYFAVDLKETEITCECIERARALVDYRNSVAAYLAPIEALNEQARLQKEIRRELQRNRGQMRYRDLCRKLSYQDYGIDVWNRAMLGLVNSGELIVFYVTTPGAKRKTHMIGLAKQDD